MQLHQKLLHINMPIYFMNITHYQIINKVTLYNFIRNNLRGDFLENKS